MYTNSYCYLTNTFEIHQNTFVKKFLDSLESGSLYGMNRVKLGDTTNEALRKMTGLIGGQPYSFRSGPDGRNAKAEYWNGYNMAFFTTDSLGLVNKISAIYADNSSLYANLPNNWKRGHNGVKYFERSSFQHPNKMIRVEVYPPDTKGNVRVELKWLQ